MCRRAPAGDVVWCRDNIGLRAAARYLLAACILCTTRLPRRAKSVVTSVWRRRQATRHSTTPVPLRRLLLEARAADLAAYACCTLLLRLKPPLTPEGRENAFSYSHSLQYGVLSGVLGATAPTA